MITDWITVTRIKISGAERLYPDGLDWKLKPGVNAIVGGTALGKTTFIYALQFGVFDKMIIEGGERIEREFFKDRLTKRTAKDLKDLPPTVDVEFSLGASTFAVTRNLLTGVVLAAVCDGVPLKTAKYEETLAEKIGLAKDFVSVTRLQSHLLFFGEARFLLAWQNLLQNELLNLMFSEHGTYLRLNDLWDEVESADSEARNLSHQASRMETDLKAFVGSSNVKELERRAMLNELVGARELHQTRVNNLRKELEIEQALIISQDASIASSHKEFHQTLDQFENDGSRDLDESLLSAALALTPTTESMRHALENFFQHPNQRICPCCGRVGLSAAITALASVVADGVQRGHCVVCSKDLVTAPKRAQPQVPADASATDSSAGKLQKLLFEREQTKSRIEALHRDEAKLVSALVAAQLAEARFLQEHPTTVGNPLRIAVDEMRRRQRSAIGLRDRKIMQLRKTLRKTNAAFVRLQTKIAKAFKKYATLYLDEPCDVALLKEDELPGKKGPQIKAPHAAFFPIVSGEHRPAAQALSYAQRSFLDLAFRMAVVDVWHQQTGNTVTMIVETPEGSTDMAYMRRVGKMLRTFGNQGHTLLITTNLNNEIFLPELLAGWPKAKRDERILNLIALGKPRKVQREFDADFARILKAVTDHPVV
jgi:hypothetical protein